MRRIFCFQLLYGGYITDGSGLVGFSSTALTCVNVSNPQRPWYEPMPLAPTPPNGDHSSAVSTLSPRELDILGLAAQGLDNDAIAAELVLSVRTVERHQQNAYAKLGVQGRTARAAAVGKLLHRA